MMPAMRAQGWVVGAALLFACGTNPTGNDAGTGGGTTGSGGGAATGGGVATGGGAAGGGSTGGGTAGAGGGSTGGGSTAGGAGGGSPSDAGCGPYLYCDDFESYAAANIGNNQNLGKWRSAFAQGDAGATFDISTANPRHGAKSLHFRCGAGGPAHGTLNQRDAGGLVPGNDMYGRAFVY